MRSEAYADELYDLGRDDTPPADRGARRRWLRARTDYSLMPYDPRDWSSIEGILDRVARIANPYEGRAWLDKYERAILALPEAEMIRVRQAWDDRMAELEGD